MLFIIILCSCSVPSQLWATSVSHWVKRIARCKYKKQAGVGSCFGGYSDFSYFFPGLFRMFCWVLGAVLGISAVSATFSRIFSGFWAGFWVLFWGFLQFQLLFHRFFRMLGWVLGWCQNITIRKTKHAIKIWHSLINQIHQIMHQIDAHMNCYPKNSISSFYINQTKRNSG